MIALAIISLLVGAALGLRFKVLILVPIAFVGLMGAALSWVLFGTGAWAMVLITIGLEFGYVGITVMRFTIMPARNLQSAAEPKTIADPAF